MMQHEIQQDTWKQLAGNAAAMLVDDGMVIGLGTGSTASYLVYALAQRIQSGLRIVGAVPSSQATKDLAGKLGIPLTDLDTYPQLDLYIDGADEIDTQLQLIKGAGGALLREKIVASAARRFIVIGDISKQVTQLGHRYPVPVETVPFAATPVRKHLEALGASVQTRQLAGKTFITENSNIILDCTFPNGIANPIEIDALMHSIVGVVETGLFLNMAQQAIIGGPEGVKVLP
ncbi:MAG: ribose-5-phosphate isomerase RpiA [Chloroflexi bacterium]|nr:ribose-5-phosphate isomerase RpiA [Chloroflexota bacterium]